MTHSNLSGNLIQSDAFKTRRSSCEIFFNNGAADTDSFKNLCTAIRLYSRNTHLRQDFGNTVSAGADIIFSSLFKADIQHSVSTHMLKAFKNKIRIDTADAIA